MGLLLLASASLTLAQGGAAGYGQGGGGGGVYLGVAAGRPGGGSNMFISGETEEAQKPRPDDEDNARIWTTKSAILTPGDRVEFKFDLKKGETLMASATSDAFDPALSVVDPKGKEIAKNDDREDGDQSPFVIARAPEAGTYILKVLSFRSVSGGKFAAKFRTFLANDATLSPQSYGPIPADTEGDGRAILRLTAKKGEIYDLRSVTSTKPYSFELPLVQIIGPTGVPAQDYDTIPTLDNSPVFAAKADGDYYIEYRSQNTTTFRTDYHKVATLAAKPTDNVTFDLEPRELKIVETPVVPDLIVRSKLTGAGLQQRMSVPEGPAPRFAPQGDGAYGTNRMWSWFLLNRDEQDEIVRVFHTKGVARLAVRSTSDKPQKATLNNGESLKPWADGQVINERLNIGDVRLYLLKSTKSELMKVFAASPQFQTRLEIFRLNGQLANTLMDRQRHVSTDDLYFPEADTFIVRLICDGYGGSGDYTMRRTTLVAKPYTLGTVQTMTLDGSNFGLYSMDLEAGKRYQFLVDHPEQPLRLDLLDEDGQFLVSQGLTFEGVAVQYFTPTRSGRHAFEGEALAH
ncbi:hypothetical protein EON79_16750, partial [bacterium]